MICSKNKKGGNLISCQSVYLLACLPVYLPVYLPVCMQVFIH